MKLNRWLLVLPVFLLAACGDSTQSRSGEAEPGGAKKKVDFVADVKPLLEGRCLVCHNTNTLLGHLNLETRELAMAPGPDGTPFIIPGQPQQSRFYTFTLTPSDQPSAMPPMKHRLDDEEQQLIFDWILQGAIWPDPPEGRLRTIEVPEA